MKIIEKISDRISEEIEDAKTYAMMALEIRDEFPEMARVLYTISLQEMEHMRMLHEGVANIIMKYRQDKGEPPEKMMTIYNYLHEKQIEKAAEAKNIQGMYK
jgi:ferritin